MPQPHMCECMMQQPPSGLGTSVTWWARGQFWRPARLREDLQVVVVGSGGGADSATLTPSVFPWVVARAEDLIWPSIAWAIPWAGPARN